MKYEKSSEASDQFDHKKIDWDDYNYPCCLKIFHYDSKETPDTLKSRARLLFLNHFLILFFLPWNFINNIVSAAQGLDNGGIRIAISIFVLLFWLPGAFYIFITPYMIYMKEDASTCMFYIISSVAAVWFFLWSIADFADANGWIMVADNSNAGRGAATFFSAIGAILCTVIVILTILNLVLFWRRQKSEDD